MYYTVVTHPKTQFVYRFKTWQEAVQYGLNAVAMYSDSTFRVESEEARRERGTWL